MILLVCKYLVSFTSKCGMYDKKLVPIILFSPTLTLSNSFPIFRYFSYAL